MDIDLTCATLVDFDLSNCRLRRATFTGARFVGDASFTRTRFTADAPVH